MTGYLKTEAVLAMLDDWHGHYDDPAFEADFRALAASATDEEPREIARLRAYPHKIDPVDVDGERATCGFCRRPVYESADYRGGRWRHAGIRDAPPAEWDRGSASARPAVPEALDVNALARVLTILDPHEMGWEDGQLIHVSTDATYEQSRREWAEAIAREYAALRSEEPT